MKKSFLKKALVMAGAALLALPLALDASVVNAADEAPTETQNILLTKYAYTTNPGDDATSPADSTGYETLPKEDQPRAQGVKFSIYDATNAYWSNVGQKFEPDTVKGSDLSDAKTTAPIRTGLTDVNGQIHFNALPTSSLVNGKSKPAVYLFAEDPQSAKDYGTQADFVLSLPVKVDGKKLDTVHVYPKNTATETHNLKFVKQDSETNEPLAGAGFKITNAKGQYASIADAKTVTGFNPNAVDVKWVDADAEDEATEFFSDDKGEFGFTAYAESTKGGDTYGLKGNGEYNYEETTVPNGYTGAQNGQINEKNGVKDDALTVLNTPKGLLPHTGGAGIILFIVLGAALVVLGGVAYNKRRTSF